MRLFGARPGVTSRRARHAAASREVPVVIDQDQTQWFSGTRGRSRWVWLSFDLVGVVAVGLLVGVVLWGTYGVAQLWSCVLGGVLVGALVGWLGWWRAWRTGRVALATAAGWFLVGGALAMPSSTRWGLVPTGRTLHGMARAPLTAWKQMLTFDAPIGETGNLLCVPLALAIVCGLTAFTISLRTTRPWLAWVPSAGCVLLAALLSNGPTPAPVTTALVTSALPIVWSSYRLGTSRSQLVRGGGRQQSTRPLVGAAVLAGVGLVALPIAPLLRPGQQPVLLRQTVEQPLDLRNHPSPLQGFRADVQPERRDQVLFTVDGQLPDGAVVRLATLDSYDGVSYNVSTSDDGDHQVGQFRRVGERITQSASGQPYRVRVTIGELGGQWVPTVGRSTRIDFVGGRELDLAEGLFYNRETSTGLVTSGLRPGDQYLLEGISAQRPADQVIADAGPGQAVLPPARQVPDLAVELARTWRDGATGGRALLVFEKELRKGWFSHGTADETPSLPGHTSARIQALLARSQLTPASMLGDEEQYAVAMALMAQSIGVPARVVQGYRLPAGGSGDVTGAQVGAWTECQLDGLGWVLFDPTPDHNRTLDKLPPHSPPVPDKRVDDPPPRPKMPRQPPLDAGLPTDEAKAPPQPPRIDWRAVGQWTAVLGIPLVFLVGPVVAILLAKRRRRLARRRSAVVANRMAGAWAEVVDRVRDLGEAPSPAATRSEQAEELVLRHPELVAHSDPIGVAKSIDHGVFRPEPVSEAQADEVWQATGGVLAGLRKVLSRGKWLRSRLSTRSFRRYR